MVALTKDQGIPNQINGLQELYDWITKMIQTTLTNAGEMDPEKSVLVKAVKLAHPETYSGGSDLEEFKTFVASIVSMLYYLHMALKAICVLYYLLLNK